MEAIAIGVGGAALVALVAWAVWLLVYVREVDRR
jgi:hypothetical protein